MNKLSLARKSVEKALGEARSPILLWSSGKDSMLLLHLIREIADTPLLWFRDALAGSQKAFPLRVIKELGLTVYGYPPAKERLMFNQELTLIREYDLGGELLPVLVDVVLSEDCIHPQMGKHLARFNYGWDTSFVGWKRTDFHPLVKDTNLDGLHFGKTTFISPLKDFTDREIWEAIHTLKIPYDHKRYAGQIEYDPDVLLACEKCLECTKDLRKAA